MLAALNETYWKPLQQVTTRSQAAREYGVTIPTVQYWIDRGYIVATQVGTIWIISVPSLRAFRGKPQTSFQN